MAEITRRANRGVPRAASAGETIFWPGATFRWWVQGLEAADGDGAVRVDAVVEDKSPGEPAAIVARGLIMDDEGCAKESKVSWPTPGSSVGAATSANADAATQPICLSGLAAERAAKGEPRIRLLLDGTAFLYSIFRHARLGPSWEWAIGGEYGIMDSALRKRVQLLHAAGIELLFLQDPAHGATLASKDLDLEQSARFKQNCENISRVMSLLSSDARLEEWRNKEVGVEWKMPPMTSDQMSKTLEDLGVQVKRCVEEADVEIAEMNRATPGSFILAKDSDFCIMQGVEYLPLEHLEISEKGIHARLITNNSMLHALRLGSYSRLPEVAILCGSDMTKNLPGFHSLVETALDLAGEDSPPARAGGPRVPPGVAAAFLAGLPDGTTLAAHPPVAEMLAASPDLARVFKAATAFYLPAPSGAPACDAPGEASEGEIARGSVAGRAGESDRPASEEEEEEGGVGLPACAGEGETFDQQVVRLCGDFALPAWVTPLRAHRVRYLGARVEHMKPGASGIDNALLPFRLRVYSLILSSPTDHREGGAESGVEGRLGG
ncbi:hypothetical protein T484DRAFT_1915504, partial [Baffinella frigidus]